MINASRVEVAMVKGCSVHHKAFGQGIVTAVQDDHAVVQFEGEGHTRKIVFDMLEIVTIPNAIIQGISTPDNSRNSASAVMPLLDTANMVLFPETGSTKLFPADAKKFYRDGKLISLYRAHGPGLLWRSADYIRGRGQPEKNKKTIEVPIPDKPAITTIAAARVDELSGVEIPKNVIALSALPHATVQSLISVLGAATYQSLRDNHDTMNQFFQGFLTGAHTVLGIVCGALNIDTSFLEVQDAITDENS